MRAGLVRFSGASHGILHHTLSSQGLTIWGPHAMPQAHVWMVVVGLSLQPRKGFSFLGVCSLSCWDLGCNRRG